MKKKIAYFMHVDWNWIKQRPHFIAEKLADSYEVDLYFIRSLKNRELVINKINPDRFKSINIIRKVPFSSRFKLLNIIEDWLNWRATQGRYIKYDYIWITHPIMLQFFHEDKFFKNNTKIIYDCMDDVLEFPQKDKIKKHLYELEQNLLMIADSVIVSSLQLERKVKERGYQRQISVINNGIELRAFQSESKKLTQRVTLKKDLYNIVYFGTISQWFDFNLIRELLELHQDIEFTIIGPSEVPLVIHERITYTGMVRHDELVAYAQKADAFIMPFILNDLILSVDPVKVYEYIYFLKPCFIVKYQETLKFNDLVYLYTGLQDLSQKIEDVKNNKFQIDKGKIICFLRENSWDRRVEKINTILRELDEY